jgi:hypothetical protein
MPRVRKLLLLLLVFAPLLFCGYKIAAYGLQIYLNRTPAQVTDLPIYPGAQDLRYLSCEDPSLANCSTLTYSANASTADVHALYEDFLRGETPFPKRMWLGDGTRYPGDTIVNYYHKAAGHFQILTVTTVARPTGSVVTIVLYDQR